MRAGDRILCRDSIIGPARVLIQDPCPLGLLEVLTGAHAEFENKDLEERVSGLLWFTNRVGTRYVLDFVRRV